MGSDPGYRLVQLLSDTKLKAKVARPGGGHHYGAGDAGTERTAASAPPKAWVRAGPSSLPDRPVLTWPATHTPPPRMVPQTVNMASSPRWCAPSEQPETRVSEEGANLLSGHKSE